MMILRAANIVRHDLYWHSIVDSGREEAWGYAAGFECVVGIVSWFYVLTYIR
jgi:hypothetical protein